MAAAANVVFSMCLFFSLLFECLHASCILFESMHKEDKTGQFCVFNVFFFSFLHRVLIAEIQQMQLKNSVYSHIYGEGMTEKENQNLKTATK